MASRRLKTIFGVAMVGMGVVQASLYAVQNEWVFIGFGVFYSLLGIAYLWAEVYAAD